MTQTVARLFDRYHDAADAVASLEAGGVPHADISIIASNADGAHDHRVQAGGADDGADKEAAVGGVIGGRLAGLAVDRGLTGYGPTIRTLFLVDATGCALAVAALVLEG
jgi:hypothetical protein